MKKQILSMMVCMLSLVMAGCDKEMEVFQKNAQDVVLDDNAMVALGLIDVFREDVSQTNSRNGGLEKLKILEVDKNYFVFNKMSDSDVESRSGNAEENVEVYTFKFELNDQEGFAIVSPDERINQVLAYCEKGSLADTAYIAGLARVIENLPYACAEILADYYDKTSNSRSVLESQQVTVNNFITTRWGQDRTYATYCPLLNCGGVMRHARVGHVAVAGGQAIHYLLGGIEEPAALLYRVAVGCKTEFGCNYSYSKTSLLADYLEQIGFNQVGKPEFIYEKSSSFNNQKLFDAINKKLPVIAGGVAKGGDGYEWLYTGMIAEVSGNNIHFSQLYCNWGIEGEGDGWYLEADGFNQPKYPSGKGIIDDRPFNSSNTYIVVP